MERKCRAWLSVLMVLCLILGLVPAYAFAATEAQGLDVNGDGKVHYVSVGASNTNGYGMRGYITEEELAAMLSGQVSKNEVNVYGYQRTPEGAYPDLIRDWCVDQYGADNVIIDQLAISSMRVEELRVLLDEGYMGDDYTSWRFTCDGGWFQSAVDGGLEALRDAYKQSITDADLLTVDIGWNNFGVYVCNQLVDYLTTGHYKWTTDLADIFDTEAELQAALESKEIIRSYIEQNVGEGELADVVTDIFAYSILGYMHNFDIVMEKIQTLNPDAKVVVLGIQNLIYGVQVDLAGQRIALGDIFGNFVNMANYYASACSPYQSGYQYVMAGENDHVNIFLDQMKQYEGDAEHLNQNVKDCFDYYDDDLLIQTRIDYAAAALIEKEFGSALSALGYTDSHEVVAKGKKGELGKLQSVFDDMYNPALYAAYDTLAVLVKYIATMDAVQADGLLSSDLKFADVKSNLIDAISAEVTENAMAAADGEAYTVDLEKIMPDANAEALAAMYVRYYMGNSFFAHPDEVGHGQILEAVQGVVTNPDSEQDQQIPEYLAKSVHLIHQKLCGATTHSFGEFTITKKPTCVDKGELTKVCAICGATETQPVAATGEHSGGEATCIEGPKCDGCGIVYGEPNANNHKGQTEVRNQVAVDCGNDGYTGDTYCLDCGEKIAGGVTIPATGNHEDKNYDLSCDICGTEVDPPSDPIEITSVNVVGSAGLLGLEWDITVNEMEKIDGVYKLVLTNVPAGTYYYRFAANGAWDIVWSADCETVSGEIYTVYRGGSNSTLVVAEDGSTVELTLDLTGMNVYTGEGGTCSVVVTVPETPPTEPSVPSEPSEPSVPSEPSEPSVPSEPSEPSEPTDPSEPSEPSQPTDPSEPSEPENPDTLEAPVIKSCYSKAQTSVKVTWNLVPGAAGYELWRTTNPEDESSYVLTKTVTDGSKDRYTNQGLDVGVTYYYKVRAYRLDDQGQKVYSEFSAMRYMPAAVVADNPYSNATFRIRLRWHEIGGAHGYQIWRQNDDGTWSIVKTLGDRDNVLTNNQGATTAYSNTGLTAGKVYTYKMRSFMITEDGKKVFGAYSDEFSVAVKPEAPVAEASGTENGRVQIRWNRVEGATGYQVWLSEAETGPYKITKSITDGDTTAYTKSGLESGKTYYIIVRAYVTVGDKMTFSTYSEVVEVTVP